MKLALIIPLFLISLSIYASDSCIAKKIELEGTYDKDTSPLLDQWSEASGEFLALGIKGKTIYQQATFTFSFPENSNSENKTYPLLKNQITKIGFKELMIDLEKKHLKRPNKLVITLYKDQEKICQHEMAIIEQDPQGGVLKKP